MKESTARIGDTTHDDRTVDEWFRAVGRKSMNMTYKKQQ